MKTHAHRRRSRHTERKGSSPFDPQKKKNSKTLNPTSLVEREQKIRRRIPLKRETKETKRDHMPSARLAKALVEKRLGEDNSFFEEEEEEEEMGRLETRVVAPLLEMYEREELARFFSSGGGIGETKGDDVDEAKEKDDSGEKEEEEDEDEDEDEDGEEEDAKMRRLFARGGSDGREYELKSAVEEETKEKNEKEKRGKNRTSTHGGEKISIVWLDGRNEEEEEEEEDSVLARIAHHKFEEHITLHDPYLRDDGLLLSYVDLVNEKCVDAYAFDRADSFGTFRKMRVIFFSVKREKNRIETKAGEKKKVSFTIRKIEETFRNCGNEEEDGGYGRDMRIERATFESRTNAAVFEFLPKGTSLFGETKTWRKNEKKESEKDDLKSNATIRIGQNKEEEEEKREEMNVNEESTVFLRKRLPFFAASFDEFGERAGREAYSSARKALEDFFSSEAMKMFKNRKSETTRDDETAVRTTNPIDSKTKVLSVNAQQELIDKEIFTELEHEALRLEIEQASRQITENCQTVLAQIDANKKHFQRRALKDRAESAYKSMQKAKLVLDKTKVDKEKERDAASRENVMEKVRAEKEERRAPRVGKDLAAPPAALASGSSQHLDDLSSAFRKTRVVFEACRRRCDRVACASGVASGDGVRKYDDAATLKREGNI